VTVAQIEIRPIVTSLYMTSEFVQVNIICLSFISIQILFVFSLVSVKVCIGSGFDSSLSPPPPSLQYYSSLLSTNTVL